ncbi:MAG: lipopolysaccharide biosynthesis protein, partial [Acidobacteriota bacterium]|nr:lipopolysaccharide biosynthesis protein [Acidobacteriota bacterium]
MKPARRRPAGRGGEKIRASHPLTLRRNFSWTLAGNVVYAACQWAILISLAKLGDVAMVGQFALALAIVTPTLAFTNLQLRALEATDAKGEFPFSDYLAVRILTVTLALCVVAGVLMWGGYDRELFLVVLAVALTKTFDSLSDVFYGALQLHGRMDRIAKSLILQGVLQLLALLLIVSASRSLLAGVIGMALM